MRAGLCGAAAVTLCIQAAGSATTISPASVPCKSGPISRAHGSSSRAWWRHGAQGFRPRVEQRYNGGTTCRGATRAVLRSDGRSSGTLADRLFRMFRRSGEIPGNFLRAFGLVNAAPRLVLWLRVLKYKPRSRAFLITTIASAPNRNPGPRDLPPVWRIGLAFCWCGVLRLPPPPGTGWTSGCRSQFGTIARTDATVSFSKTTSHGKPLTGLPLPNGH